MAGDHQSTEPAWTDAEHEEIMRLHIIDGLTISEAKHRVFAKLQSRLQGATDPMTNTTGTNTRQRPEGDMWRVDVSGYPVSVRGKAAYDHLQQVNLRLAKMKMALHRICKMHPDTDTMNVARDGLYQ